MPRWPAAAALPLALVGVVIAWWGWKSGAYFGVVFLPGAMALLGLTATMLLFAPWPAALRGGARVALLALLGLAGWTLLSALWSPAPDIAISDAQHVFGYAVAFVLGIWLCLLLGRRMLQVLLPLALAGAAVALATLIALWVGDSSRDFFEIDATLRYPLGYRNAVAAFFITAVWPMLVLAASRDQDWRLRGALLAAASLSIELAVLAQSRSSVFAVLIGAAILVAFHPARLRIVGWLALAGIPVVLALPWLLDVFQSDGGNTAASIPPLHAACSAMAISSGFGLLLGLAAARADPGIALSPRTRRMVGRTLLAGLAALVAVGAIALARAEGGPIGFVDRHLDQLNAGTPDLDAQGTRFGLDLRSRRGDFWRVALDDFAASPVAGTGAGGFRSSYLLERSSNTVQPEDPHSLELLIASELGLPGLVLLALFIGGAAVAILRARRLGPSSAALAAAALAVGGYWLAHASVEWFWSYPAITLPAIFALGAAAAPALLRPSAPPRRGPRVALAAAAVLGVLAMTPFLLSERYTNDALRTWESDLDGAYDELQTAADLNPVSDRPLAAEAVIAEAAGDDQRALAALDRAERREPDEWTLYYLEARVLAPIDPAGARRALLEANSLNPGAAELAGLARRLDVEL